MLVLLLLHIWHYSYCNMNATFAASLTRALLQSWRDHYFKVDVSFIAILTRSLQQIWHEIIYTFDAILFAHLMRDYLHTWRDLYYTVDACLPEILAHFNCWFTARVLDFLLLIYCTFPANLLHVHCSVVARTQLVYKMFAARLPVLSCLFIAIILVHVYCNIRCVLIVSIVFWSIYLL
jgi:hypothetical protein